jgi:hypothetical protein
MLGALFTLFGVVAFFFWAVLGHSTAAELQRTIDASCPSRVQYIRYPDGYHQAVCNPTNTTWRN